MSKVDEPITIDVSGAVANDVNLLILVTPDRLIDCAAIIDLEELRRPEISAVYIEQLVGSVRAAKRAKRKEVA